MAFTSAHLTRWIADSGVLIFNVSMMLATVIVSGFVLNRMDKLAKILGKKKQLMLPKCLVVMTMIMWAANDVSYLVMEFIPITSKFRCIFRVLKAYATIYTQFLPVVYMGQSFLAVIFVRMKFLANLKSHLIAGIFLYIVATIFALLHFFYSASECLEVWNSLFFVGDALFFNLQKIYGLTFIEILSLFELLIIFLYFISFRGDPHFWNRDRTLHLKLKKKKDLKKLIFIIKAGIAFLFSDFLPLLISLGLKYLAFFNGIKDLNVDLTPLGQLVLSILVIIQLCSSIPDKKAKVRMIRPQSSQQQQQEQQQEIPMWSKIRKIRRESRREVPPPVPTPIFLDVASHHHT